jgi:hypothetical protein
MSGHSDQFRAFARQRLAETGVSMRKLSRAMGRDDAYVSQLLDPPPGRSRPMPTPVELRAAAVLLDVPYMQLLMVVWGVTEDDIASYYKDIGIRLAGVSIRWSDYTASELEELLDYASYLLVRRSLRPSSRVASAEDRLQD